MGGDHGRPPFAPLPSPSSSPSPSPARPTVRPPVSLFLSIGHVKALCVSRAPASACSRDIRRRRDRRWRCWIRPGFGLPVGSEFPERGELRGCVLRAGRIRERSGFRAPVRASGRARAGSPLSRSSDLSPDPHGAVYGGIHSGAWHRKNHPRRTCRTDVRQAWGTVKASQRHRPERLRKSRVRKPPLAVNGVIGSIFIASLPGVLCGGGCRVEIGRDARDAGQRRPANPIRSPQPLANVRAPRVPPLHPTATAITIGRTDHSRRN